MDTRSLQLTAASPRTDTIAQAAGEERTRRWLRPAACFGLTAMLLAGLSRLTIVDLDLFHEMSLVREVLTTGHFPLADPFAYTPTVSPVVHHEWGTGVVLYAVTVASGLGATGLMILKYALSAFLVAGCFLCARRRGATEAITAFVAPLFLPMALCGFSTVRAQLFTLCFVVTFLLLLSRDGAGRRWLLPWLVLYAVWLNMHAGFLVGFGLFTVYTGERLVRSWRTHGSLSPALRETWPLIACACVMALLPVMSPFGTAYFSYLWRAVRMPRPIIEEWLPLWSAQYGEVLLCFSVSLALVVYAAVSRGFGALRDVTLLLAPAYLAVQHSRHLPIYAVVWMCLAPAWLAPTGFGRQVAKLWHNRAGVLVAFWLVFGSLSLVYACNNRFWRLRIPISPAEASEGVPIYPVGAVDFLAEHAFRGNLMVPFGAGSYVSWKLYPAVRVSLDSRYEVAYPPAAAEEAVRFFAADEGWQATLARYPTDAVLVPWWSPLNGLLDAGERDADGSDWQRVYRDDAYAVYMPPRLARRYPPVDRSTDAVRASFP